MSATIISDPIMVVSQPDTQTAPPPAKLPPASQIIEVEFAKCECCGLTEECTPAYITRIRERFEGRWICGLCSEAVKDEIFRSDRLIGTDEALIKHMNFRKKFRSSSPPPTDPTLHLIAAMRQLLRKTLDSPTAHRSTPSSPISGGKQKEVLQYSSLKRSESCFSSLTS